MKHIFCTVAAVIGCAITTPALAQEKTDGPVITAAITGGTLGIGPEARLRVSKHFGVRVNASLLTINGEVESDGIDFDGSIRLRSGGIMADVFPFGGAFRISAGARINGTNARLDATPTELTEIGDVEYTPAQIGTLRGRADTPNLAPAITVGFGGSKRKGFVFGAEAGVLFQGSVRIRNFTASGTAANDATFNRELVKQRDELQSDVNDYKLYPILQLSVGYRF